MVQLWASGQLKGLRVTRMQEVGWLWPPALREGLDQLQGWPRNGRWKEEGSGRFPVV